MRLFTLALSLFCFTSFAYANDVQVEAYRYGTKLDIAHVVSIKTQSSNLCQPVTAVMTYKDSHGAVHKMSYTVLSDECLNEH